MAKDPRALLQQAEALRKSGRLSDAIDACIKALDTQPGLDALRVTLGRTYLESGQADLAKATLAEVFARLPEHHLAGKLLAEAQKETGEGSAAEETCLRLLATYPRDREIEALLKSVRESGPQDRVAAGAAATPREPAPARAPAPMRAVAPPAEPAVRATTGETEADPLPDYVPEDVAGGAPELTPPRAAATTEAGPATMSATTATGTPTAPPTPAATAPAIAAAAISPMPAPASAAPTSAPATPAPAAKPPGRDALQTNTLAELYVKQGLLDRALEVYRGMLRVDPTNERARRRLEELQSTPAPESVAVAAAAVARPSSEARVPPARPAPAAPAAPAAFADPAAASRAAAIRRLEEWLTLMKSGRDADRRAGR